MTVKFRQRPPFVVNGGLTRWVITAEYYDKNHSKLAIVARCLDDKTKSVVLEQGSRRHTERYFHSGIQAKLGTDASRILSRMVRDGQADILQR